MPKLVPISYKKLIKLVQRLGFIDRDAEGSHVFFSHRDGRTTVIPHKNGDIPKGTLRKVLRDIEVSVKEYDLLRKR